MLYLCDAKLQLGFLIILWKFLGRDPSQNIGTKIRISLLTNGTERISLSISVKERNNMHFLDRAFTYNLSLVTSINRFCNPSILKWFYGINVFRCFRFVTGLCSSFFFFTRDKLLKNPPFTVLACLIASFFNISFTSPCLYFFVVLDLLLIGKESLIEKVSFERELHNHLLLYCMKISRFRGRVQKTAKLKSREKSFNGQPRNKMHQKIWFFAKKKKQKKTKLKWKYWVLYRRNFFFSLFF